MRHWIPRCGKIIKVGIFQFLSLQWLSFTTVHRAAAQHPTSRKYSMLSRFAERVRNFPATFSRTSPAESWCIGDAIICIMVFYCALISSNGAVFWFANEVPHFFDPLHIVPYYLLPCRSKIAGVPLEYETVSRTCSLSTALHRIRCLFRFLHSGRHPYSQDWQRQGLLRHQSVRNQTVYAVIAHASASVCGNH